jgi:hypothetical protein
MPGKKSPTEVGQSGYRPHGGKGSSGYNAATRGCIPLLFKKRAKKSPAEAGQECVIVLQGKDDSGIVTQPGASTRLVRRERQHASRECEKVLDSVAKRG